jgi:PLP dependent protein
MRNNWLKIKERIHLSAKQHARDPSEVCLIAVSKRHSVQKIQSLYDCGQRVFAENMVQEAVKKIQELKALPITWHFIGAIQSNKTRALAEHFSWVQSLSSLKHARRLNEQRPEALPALNVCIQINISEEDNKSGVDASELLPFAKEIATLPRLKLRGIMALPAIESDEEKQRAVFMKLKELQDVLNQAGFDCDTLSIGMSGDFELAIEAGSTMIRIGTGLFGARPSFL